MYSRRFIFRKCIDRQIGDVEVYCMCLALSSRRHCRHSLLLKESYSKRIQLIDRYQSPPHTMSERVLLRYKRKGSIVVQQILSCIVVYRRHSCIGEYSRPYCCRQSWRSQPDVGAPGLLACCHNLDGDATGSQRCFALHTRLKVTVPLSSPLTLSFSAPPCTHLLHPQPPRPCRHLFCLV